MQEIHENSLWEANCTCCLWNRHRDVEKVASGDGGVRFLSWLCDGNSSVMSWKSLQVSLLSDSLQGLFQLRGMVVLVFRGRAGVQEAHCARPPEAVGMERQEQVTRWWWGVKQSLAITVDPRHKGGEAEGIPEDRGAGQ